MRDFRALVGIWAVTGLALAPACRNTEEGVKEDARQNAEAAQQGAQDVRKDAGDAAHQMGESAKEAGREIGAAAKAGAKEVASEVGAKTQTVDVKTHLMADRSIDASHIDVDTDADTKTVILKGTVPTAAQKAAAEKVAREQAEGYRVLNQLTVAEK